MEFFDVIQKRRSVRDYTGEAVPKAALEQIIDAARMAPSGNNRQPWHFVVVSQPERIAQVSEFFADGFAKCGAYVAIVLDPSQTHYCIQDGSAAIENLMLAAAALGYGTCWLEGYTSRSEDQLKQLLNIPADFKLQTMISVGVPTQWPTREKKSREEVLHWEQF